MTSAPHVELFDSVYAIGDNPNGSSKAKARLFLKAELRGTHLELADYETTWQKFVDTYECNEYNMHVIAEFVELTKNFCVKGRGIMTTTVEALEEWNMMVVHAFLRDRMIPSIIEIGQFVKYSSLLSSNHNFRNIMDKDNLWRDLAAAMERVLPEMDYGWKLRALHHVNHWGPWKDAVLKTSYVPTVYKQFYGDAEMQMCERDMFQRLLAFHELRNLFDFVLSPTTSDLLVHFATQKIMEPLMGNSSVEIMFYGPWMVDVLARLASDFSMAVNVPTFLQLSLVRDEAEEKNPLRQHRSLIESWVDSCLVALSCGYDLAGHQQAALLRRLLKLPTALATARSTIEEEGEEAPPFRYDDFSLCQQLYQSAEQATRSQRHRKPSKLFVLAEDADTL